MKPKSIAPWGPIGTAPKDGTEILGVNAAGERAVVFWHNWSFSGLPVEYDGWELCVAGDYAESADHDPVYWTEIPEIPEGLR